MKIFQKFSIFGAALGAVLLVIFLATSQSNSTKGLEFSKDEVNDFGEDNTMLATYDGSDYVNIFNTLLSKRYRFIILRRDTYNTNNIKLDAGPWEWLFSDFANAIDPYTEQVGFIFLGQKGKENLYMVVFNPKYQNRNAAQVLEGFRLPTEPRVLQKWGLPTVNYFTTRDKADLTLDNVIMTSKTTGVVSFLEDDMTRFISDDNFDDISLFAATQSTFGDLKDLNELANKKNRFVVLYYDQSKGQSPKSLAAPWDWKVKDLRGFVKPNIGQVAFVWIGENTNAKLYMIVINPQFTEKTTSEILKFYGLPADPKELSQYNLPIANTLVVKDRKELIENNIVSQSQPGRVIGSFVESFELESPSMLATYDGSDYVNIFNTLLSKRYRFIILRRDTYNTNNIKLDAGPWEWLFSDFANAIDPYTEQVGFIFLGQKGKENLYMVVFNPKYQNRNAAQVLEGFRLPTEPRVLQKWGLPTVNYFTTRDKADLTLDNVIMTSKTTGVVSFLEDDSLTILAASNHAYELNNSHAPKGIIRRERHNSFLLDDDDSSPMLSTMDSSLDQDLE